MPRRPLLIALALAVALSGASVTTAGGAPRRAAPGPAPTLVVSTVLSGLHRPWDLAFTPGGGMLFTERAGPIKFRIAANGVVRQLGIPFDVVAQGEGGMMGIAVDPSFGTNRRVYGCFLSNRSGSLDVRIVRWRMNEAVTALTDRTDIVTGLPVSTGRHSGCRPRFGPDGRLWIATGDAAQPNNPQSPTSLGGKVLRVDTNGNGVPGNAPAPFDPRIYTYGHRNVQGLAFSPGGKAYSIEHGTGRDDELNRLLRGANYGWDPRPLSGPSFYDESRPMTDRVRHPDAWSAVWSSGDPTIAPSGGTFLSGPRWKAWDRCVAMAVLKDHHLRILCLNTTGMSVISQASRISDRGRLRVAVLNHTNNNLYIATDEDPGTILRVIPH
jgi:glucose/arabinose dehydrogenase